MMEKNGKSQFKIFWNSISHYFHDEIFIVTILWKWFYISKSMFFEIYLELFHWKSINFSIFYIQFSLCWRIFLIDYLPDSSSFWIFVGKNFNFLLDLFNIRNLGLGGDSEILKLNLDKKFDFFQKFSWIFSTLEIKF